MDHRSQRFTKSEQARSEHCCSSSVTTQYGAPEQRSSTGCCQLDDTRGRHDVSRNQLHDQGLLLPDQVDILISPAFNSGRGLDVKIEQKTSQGQTHFKIGQAVVPCQLPSRAESHHGSTHLRPMQFLGPKLKGCTTLRLSLAKRPSVPIQRSGMNSSTSTK